MKKLLPLFFLAGCSLYSKFIESPTVPETLPAPVTTELTQQQEEQDNAVYTEKTLSLPVASIPGIDFLGAAHSSATCDSFIGNTPKGFAGGIFWDAFGPAGVCIKKMCDSGRFARIRVHLHWEDSHGCNPGRFNDITAAAHALDSIASRCRTPIEASGWCENACDARNSIELQRRVSAACPHCAAYVSSTLSGITIPGAITENHGSHPRKPSGRYQVSFDGNSAVDADVENWKKTYAGAEVQFFWIPAFNGRHGPNDHTPRPQRTGWPSTEQIQSVVDLAEPTKSDVKLPPGWIYKSNSEPWGSGHGHPVLIIPQSNQRIQMIATNGKLLGAFTNAGSYIGGGFRYYAPEWGYQLAHKARALSVSRLAYIRINGKNYGPIDPNRRAGTFHD